MAPRNSNNAESNKTLRTPCAACGADTPTDVRSDPKQRKTWALAGERDGRPVVFAVCDACYRKGWRPPGHEAA